MPIGDYRSGAVFKGFINQKRLKSTNSVVFLNNPKEKISKHSQCWATHSIFDLKDWSQCCADAAALFCQVVESARTV